MTSIDEIIALYMRDVDMTLIDEALKRMPQERIEALEEFERFREEHRSGLAGFIGRNHRRRTL